MNFELNETQKNLQKTMAAFCQTEILPDAATLDEFKAFNKKYYTPSNSVLVIAGDIDIAKKIKTAKTCLAGESSESHFRRPRSLELRPAAVAIFGCAAISAAQKNCGTRLRPRRLHPQAAQRRR